MAPSCCAGEFRVVGQRKTSCRQQSDSRISDGGAFPTPRDRGGGEDAEGHGVVPLHQAPLAVRKTAFIPTLSLRRRKGASVLLRGSVVSRARHARHRCVNARSIARRRVSETPTRQVDRPRRELRLTGGQIGALSRTLSRRRLLPQTASASSVTALRRGQEIGSCKAALTSRRPRASGSGRFSCAQARAFSSWMVNGSRWAAAPSTS